MPKSISGIKYTRRNLVCKSDVVKTNLLLNVKKYVPIHRINRIK